MAETSRQFIHLRVRSEYSLYDSTIKLTEYVEEAKRRGLTHLSVTDENLFGAVEFNRLCREHGINPIIGCDFKITSPLPDGTAQEGVRLLLIAENNQGYGNLLKLSTHYFLDQEQPALTEALLKEYHGGLIAITGGMIGEERLQDFEEIFGKGNLFIEIQAPEGEEARENTSLLRSLSQRSGIQLLATIPVHYLHKEEASSYLTLRKIGVLRGVVDDTQTTGAPDYFRTSEQMESLFSEIPEAIENTIMVARRCSISLPLQAPSFPKISLPSEYASSHEYLQARVAEGLSDRYGTVSEEVSKRAHAELEAVQAVGYSDYFLITADIVAFARRSGIPVGPGRGASPGFLINYALGITDIDPLAYGLLSQRFLNPERIANPAIGIDFCFERKKEVAAYIRDTYGHDHTAKIISFGRYKGRSVIHDVGSVMGLSFSQIESLSKKLPQSFGVTIKKAIEEVPELQAEVERESLIGKVLKNALVLEGLPRVISTHAVGIAVSRESMDSYAPLYKSDGWEWACTQFTKNQLAEVGVVSFDLLGFKVLTLLNHCQLKIQERNPSFTLSEIPEDDEKAFSLLGEGDTLGVFQCESVGIQEVLRKVKPKSIEELSAIHALYRPGAMEMIPEYIEAKQSGSLESIFPERREILDPGYGILMYEEQIMEIAHTVAAWSYGKADILRRALGKRDARSIEDFQESFILDAGKKGYSRQRAKEIFELLAGAAPIAALKAHIVSYSLLAYRSAFLKAHYPREYMESLLQLEKDNPARYEEYERAAEEMGIR